MSYNWENWERKILKYFCAFTKWFYNSFASCKLITWDKQLQLRNMVLECAPLKQKRSWPSMVFHWTCLNQKYLYYLDITEVRSVAISSFCNKAVRPTSSFLQLVLVGYKAEKQKYKNRKLSNMRISFTETKIENCPTGNRWPGTAFATVGYSVQNQAYQARVRAEGREGSLCLNYKSNFHSNISGWVWIILHGVLLQSETSYVSYPASH